MRDDIRGEARQNTRRAPVPARKPNMVDMHVGRRLRLARTLKGLSQRNLGDLLDLTFQQVQKYEQGLNRIGAGLLYELACVLDVQVDFFFEEIPGELKSCPPDRILTDNFPGDAADREILDIVRAFQAIRSDSLRKQVRVLADALGERGRPR